MIWRCGVCGISISPGVTVVRFDAGTTHLLWKALHLNWGVLVKASDSLRFNSPAFPCAAEPPEYVRNMWTWTVSMFSSVVTTGMCTMQAYSDMVGPIVQGCLKCERSHTHNNLLTEMIYRCTHNQQYITCSVGMEID